MLIIWSLLFFSSWVVTQYSLWDESLFSHHKHTKFLSDMHTQARRALSSLQKRLYLRSLLLTRSPPLLRCVMNATLTLSSLCLNAFCYRKQPEPSRLAVPRRPLPMPLSLHQRRPHQRPKLPRQRRRPLLRKLLHQSPRPTPQANARHPDPYVIFFSMALAHVNRSSRRLQ